MKKLILIIISISFSFNPLFAGGNEINVQKKADFIIMVAENITYNDALNNKDYKIAVFGNNREIRELFKELKLRGEGVTIQGKSVDIFQFKRLSQVEPVDLIYITGDSKIRLNSLNKKLEGRPNIMLTENFPFGTSALNFSINKDDELFFEIREEHFNERGAKVSQGVLQSKKRVDKESTWEKKLDAALVIIEEKEQALEEQEITIKEKSQEIKKQDKVINSLQTIIIIVALSLAIISALVVILFKINKQRKIGLKTITDSINYSKYIQDSILRNDKLDEKHWEDYFILYKPKDIVSGDFYWITHEDDKLFFMVADCTGHGVPGAMLSLICYNALKKAIKELKIYEPAKILDKTSIILGDLLPENGKMKDGMDLALCCLHLKSNKLEFAGAKNPLYYVRNNELLKIKSDRQTIDTNQNRKQHTNHILEYKKGDVFYVFSDGYADQFGGEENKKYSYSKFRKILLENHNKSMSEQQKILEDSFSEWKGKYDQIDDICVMGIRV